ncbi:metal ABC transporter permease [Mobilicoccus pelagius]|uniref:Putative metal ABC transporter permease protein n=1 Tax=Mobilicoccus pelagius NBRC 104925 TaxID=1089455 RepID=H5UQH9_9MICO|nr:metal ABC transporter permease [Mobilicoccus pelagius]GAB47987.1 putative metal ABC transporter permease protein [Mobilicoccus pelagius NBRC 104925]
MLHFLTYEFMQRALLAAVFIGAAAPMVGIFLMQRRLTLIGDGMGHVAFAGVALGAVTGTQPVWTALALAVAAAVAIELMRARGTTTGDTALAILFYGGISLGVVLMSRAPSGGKSIPAYLFGAISTTKDSDVVVFAGLAIAVAIVTWFLRPRLFAVANDPEFARASGLPVLALNVTLAVLTAITVVVSMRVVGLLLIAALMIVPNAAAQVVARSFASAMGIAVAIGLVCSVVGVVASFQLDTPSGGTIVVLAVIVYAVLASADTALGAVRGRRLRRAPGHEHAHDHPHVHGMPDCEHLPVLHEDHVDYVHDGHLHSPHGDHYDEHGPIEQCGDHGHGPGHAPTHESAAEVGTPRPFEPR